MNKLTVCVFFLLLFAACHNTTKEAEARLAKAQVMYEQHDFFAAKNEIDSIRALYPKEFNVLKESLSLMRQVDLKEAERTLSFCDSLIPIKKQEAEVLAKRFVFEKDTAYEKTGNYIWKQQTVERNVRRSYIRCGVNEKGEMYLASVYFGSAPINHTGVKFSLKDGLFAETETIPYDGGLNYHFKDLGNTTEVVTYNAEKGLNAIQFISSNEKERMKATYTGGKPFSLDMADADKKAVVETYHLSTVLSDVERMITETEKAEKKVSYLKNKLQ